MIARGAIALLISVSLSGCATTDTATPNVDTRTRCAGPCVPVELAPVDPTEAGDLARMAHSG